MLRHYRVVALCLISALTALGCSESADAPAEATGEATTGQTGETGATAETGGEIPDGTPTYHTDIAPILIRSCGSCHQAGGVGPFPLTTFAESAPLAALLADTIERGAMPPWGVEATEKCTPQHAFKDDIRLTDEEKARVRAWADAGAHEGPAADTTPEIPAPEQLSRVDIELVPKEAYITEGNQDEFICFVLDPKLEADVFIQGSRLVPGNALVAHHALVFTDPDAQSPALAGEKGYYPCFGDANVDGTQLLAAWAPGSVPNELPDNAGMPVTAGTLLVLQMHYHPTGTSAEADKTSLQLMFNTQEPEWHSLVALIGNFNNVGDAAGLLPGAGDKGDSVEFKVPAGTAAHTEAMWFESPANLFGAPNVEHHIRGVAPHMHFIGRSMTAWVERRDAKAPLCPVEEAGPLVGCLTTKCGESDDVPKCSEDECGDELAALSALCEGCLIGHLAVGDATKAFGACMGEPAYETKEQAAQECFFDSPAYDFNWQRIYQYDAAVEDLPIVRPGDILKFECTYDNSMGNSALTDALAYQGLDEPVDVFLGDTTLDEMCLLVLSTLYKPYTAAE